MESSMVGMLVGDSMHRTSSIRAGHKVGGNDITFKNACLAAYIPTVCMPSSCQEFFPKGDGQFLNTINKSLLTKL